MAKKRKPIIWILGIIPLLVIPLVIYALIMGFVDDVHDHIDGPAKQATVDARWTKVSDTIVHVNTDEDYAYGITSRGVKIEGSARDIFENGSVDIYCTPEGNCAHNKPSVNSPSVSDMLVGIIGDIIVLVIVIAVMGLISGLILDAGGDDVHRAKAKTKSKPRKTKLDLV